MEQNAGSAFITTKQGAKIFYKDWGKGDVILFSHGWPLTADAWDGQMLFLLEKGYRVIAHDRRGHGRSTQTWENNTMDQYADDLHELIEQLDLKNITLVGHSTGGGEVVRYIGRHGNTRVKKLMLLGAVPPLMLKTDKNPDGLPRDVFDNIRRSTMDNRSQFFQDLPKSFYGYNRMMHKESRGVIDSFWRQGMMGGAKSIYDSIKQFSETDFTEDLKKISVPTMLIHGDDDQIVPIDNSAKKSEKLIPNAKLKIYKGGSHGLAQVQQDEFNEDLLNFIKS
jgi:Predicted hydrolases or acyltransferases (alpha/beta hydrolase superfamily)